MERVDFMAKQGEIGLYRHGTPIMEQILNNVKALLLSNLRHTEISEITGVSAQMTAHTRNRLKAKGEMNSVTFEKIMEFNSAFDTPEKIDYIQKRDENLYHYILPELIAIDDEDMRIINAYKDNVVTIQKRPKTEGDGNYVAIKCPHCNKDIKFEIKMKVTQ